MPATPLQPSADLQARFRPVRDAIVANRARLAPVAGLVSVRPGFRYDASGPTPAVVLSFLPPLARAAGAIEQEYAAILRVPVRALEASPDEQMRYHARGVASPMTLSDFDRLLVPGMPEFRPPVRGTYQPPPGLSLDEVDEEMELTLATSPDAGWPVLRDFLGQPVRHRLQIGMYQFTAPHIYQRLRGTLLADDDARLEITMHPVPEKIRDEGTKADDIFGPDILDRLRRALGSRFEFEWMSAGPRKVFASAYHIKVAVADSRRMWLSSGNWQSSNQPPYDPLNEPDDLPPRYLGSYNREHHVVIEHAGLARTFEQYLRYDFREGGAPAAEEFAVGPDLFVPDEALEPEAFAAPRYFEPLRLSRKVRVQPLLTPDNYARHVVEQIRTAERSVWLQNQYINWNPDGELEEFTNLLAALREKMDAGLDVRIICRDLMEPEKLDLLVALGFDPNRFRFLRNTHTTVIILDGERTVIGSHNWSNDGVATNRDASLLFFDKEIAAHCGDIFEYDWQRATTRGARRQPRVARADETALPGTVRRSWETVFDDMPRARVPATAGPSPVQPADAAAAAPANRPISFGPPDAAPGASSAGADAAAPVELVLSGVDGATGRYLTPPKRVAEIAQALRATRPAIADAVRATASRSAYRTFGVPYGFDIDKPAQVGWGVIVREGDPRGLLGAIQPLLDHRRAQVPLQVCKVLEHRPGEQVRDWLTRHGVGFGTITPAKVPYHLLLVGGPDDIPFEFQYLLDLEYAVGRIAFDAPEQYTRYAQSVVRYETAPAPASSRDAVFFGPQHAGDGATHLSRTSLVGPLANGTAFLPKVADTFGFRLGAFLDADAKRAALLDMLHGRGLKPSLLFTAGHGMGFPMGDPRQATDQGGLLMQDWAGVGTIRETDYVRAADIADDAQLHGLVAFLFACYGAGTPELDAFPTDLGAPPAPIASAPFVAALPKRLLAHPNGGALGVFGHIERAWGFSITGTATQPLLNPFWNALGRIMDGACLGNVTRDFNERSALLANELADAVGPGGQPLSDADLVWRWVERNDARAYVLLGDPAARLRSKELR